MTTVNAVRGPQLADEVGITYRQLDYWTRTGLLTPSIADAHGSGSQRLYSPADVALGHVIKRILDGSTSNNSTLAKARKIAPIVRSIVEAGGATDLVLVVTADDVIPVSDGAQLLGLARRHNAVTVLAGFPDATERDAAPGATGADVNTSAAVTSGAASAGL